MLPVLPQLVCTAEGSKQGRREGGKNVFVLDPTIDRLLEERRCLSGKATNLIDRSRSFVVFRWLLNRVVSKQRHIPLTRTDEAATNSKRSNQMQTSREASRPRVVSRRVGSSLFGRGDATDCTQAFTSKEAEHPPYPGTCDRAKAGAVYNREPQGRSDWAYPPRASKLGSSLATRFHSLRPVQQLLLEGIHPRHRNLRPFQCAWIRTQHKTQTSLAFMQKRGWCAQA